jgi:hypothetical protein
MHQHARQQERTTRGRSLRRAGSTVVQAKLTVGAPDDVYEREADRLADQVVHRLATPEAAAPDDVVARAPLAGGIRDAGDLSPTEERDIEAARGGGASLDEGVRARMEDGFGADFSGIRVHTDARSDQLNHQLTAKAFTTGSDIFFGAGAYEPGTVRGDKLLAHELAHTIQQGAATSRKVARRTGAPDVQGLFGFGKKKPTPPPVDASKGKIDVSLCPVINGTLQKAEKGEAGVAEIDAELARMPQRRKQLASKGAPENAADILATLEFLERELIELRGILADVAGTKEQAKDIYVQQGKTGGLKALSPLNPFFKTPKQEPGKGVAKDLDAAEIAAVSTYTANDYKYINPAAAFSKGWLKAQMLDPDTKLADPMQKGSEKDRLEEGGLHTGMIMSAFAKLKVWSGDGYRGERLTAAEFTSQYDVDASGKKVTAKNPTTVRGAFWSVSTKRKVGENFSNGKGDAPPAADKTIGILYKIKVSNARDVAQFSAFPEAEVLCPPASSYTVTGVKARTDLIGTGVPKATAYYEVTIAQK